MVHDSLLEGDESASVPFLAELTFLRRGWSEMGFVFVSMTHHMKDSVMTSSTETTSAAL